MPNEPVYCVDFIWDAENVDENDILDIAELEPYWGQGVSEALVAIKNVKVTKDNLKMMKSNTCKITLPNGVGMIKFRMSDEEFDALYSENGCVTIDIIGKCNKNIWLDRISGQIMIEDYEIVNTEAFVF